MFGPFIKEKPLPGLIGLGGGAAGALVHAGGSAWTPAGITASGGTKVTGQTSPDGTPYTYHFFTAGPHGPNSPNPNPFNVSAVNGPGDVEYFMVAGGGVGGGSWNPDPTGGHGGGGGGGAGGVVTNFKSPNAQGSPSVHPFRPSSPGDITATAQDYTIETGRGGGGAPAPERKGTNSTAFGVTANGGGNASNSSPGLPANDGGSGGGGGSSGPNSGGDSQPGTAQGNPGGDGQGQQAGTGAGGGGASQAGQPGPGGRRGGDGINFPTPSTQSGSGFFMMPTTYGVAEPTAPDSGQGVRWFAGGGSGGGPSGGQPTAIEGGYGGGGNSGDPDSTGVPAPSGSGGGGGGSGGGPDNSYYAGGGQGLVVIRYIAD